MRGHPTEGVQPTVKCRLTQHEGAPNLQPMGIAMDLRDRAARLLRERVRGVRRDVAMVTSSLFGERSPTFTARQRPAATTPAASDIPAPSAHVAPRPARVRRITHETDRAVTVTFEPTDGAPFVFEAGQFISVDVTVGGKLVRRAYSLSVAPDAAYPAFTVKRMDGGRVSTHFTSECAEGDVFHFLGPAGHFVHDGDPTRPLVCIAGGSGITPVVSLLTHALQRHPRLQATLIYGNRRAEDVIFRDRLATLASNSGERLRVLHVLEEGDSPLRGKLTDDTLGTLLSGQNTPENALYFVCGPTPMREAARRVLLSRGVKDDAIREEVFVRPEASTMETAAAPLTIRSTRRVIETTAAPNQTVLEAGLDAGAPMPYSCAMGGCGACRVSLVSGTVTMEEPNCLTDKERRAGYVLACVSRATSPITVQLP